MNIRVDQGNININENIVHKYKFLKILNFKKLLLLLRNHNFSKNKIFKICSKNFNFFKNTNILQKKNKIKKKNFENLKFLEKI